MKRTAAARERRKPARTRTATTSVAPINYAALRWLEQRAKRPAVNDDAFWRAFDRELRENRLNLRKRP